MDEITRVVVEQSASSYGWLNVVSVLLALMTAVSSFILTFWSLKITRNSANFLLYEKYNDEYFSDQMGRSLRILSSMKRDKGDPQSEIDPDQKARFGALKNRRSDELSPEELKWMEEIEQARRYVKSYFHKLATLYVEKVIEKKRTAKLCSKGGVYIYLKIVWELEKEHYPNSPDIEQFEVIHRIVYLGRREKAKAIVPPPLSNPDSPVGGDSIVNRS